MRDGIDTVLMRNQIDPLPTPESIRTSIWRPAGRSLWPPIAPGRTRCARPVSASTRRRHSFSIPSCCNRFPDARPVDANGDPDLGLDWYLGVCPTHEGYLAAKIDRLQRVTAELEPDGLFLSFTRFPGSGRTGFPVTPSPTPIASVSARDAAPDLAKISGSAPSGRRRNPGARHPGEHGAAWTAWRARRIVAVVERIAAAVRSRPRHGSRSCSTPCPFPPPTSAGSTRGGRSRRRIWHAARVG